MILEAIPHLGWPRTHADWSVTWEALGAIGTTAAVIVALLLAKREARNTAHERDLRMIAERKAEADIKAEQIRMLSCWSTTFESNDELVWEFLVANSSNRIFTKVDFWQLRVSRRYRSGPLELSHRSTGFSSLKLRDPSSSWPGTRSLWPSEPGRAALPPQWVGKPLHGDMLLPSEIASVRFPIPSSADQATKMFKLIFVFQLTDVLGVEWTVFPTDGTVLCDSEDVLKHAIDLTLSENNSRMQSYKIDEFAFPDTWDYPEAFDTQ